MDNERKALYYLFTIRYINYGFINKSPRKPLNDTLTYKRYHYDRKTLWFDCIWMEGVINEKRAITNITFNI